MQSPLNMSVLAGLFTEKLFRPAVGPILEPRSSSSCLWQPWNQPACIPATAPIHQPHLLPFRSLLGPSPLRRLLLFCSDPLVFPAHARCISPHENCWGPAHLCWSSPKQGQRGCIKE